jgi:hypothetical protein
VPSQDNEKKSTLYSVLTWPIRPGIGKSSDGNPLTGIHPPKPPKPKKHQKFSSMEEVLEQNPEFETVRPKAMRALRIRMVFLISAFFLWGLYGLTVDSGDFFGIDWMNKAAILMVISMQIGYMFMTDVQYIVLKHRILGINISTWARIRFSGK